MKFRYVLVIFNIVLLLCFLTVFFLPAFILDFSFMKEFWVTSWYIGALFILLLLAVNVLYFSNRIVLTRLEEEDWPGLSQYLETEVFVRKKATFRKVKLLTDSLILLNDFSTIKKLESFIMANKPALYNKCSAGFAAAALISSDYGLVSSISDRAHTASKAEREWLDLFSGVSHQAQKNFTEAAECLLPLCVSAADPLIAAMAGFLCAKSLSVRISARKDELSEAAESARQRIISRIDSRKWARLVDDSKSSMHAVILAKMLDEAGQWLYR